MKRILKSSVPFIKPYDNQRDNDPVNLDNVNTMSRGNGTAFYNKCFDITFNFGAEQEVWLYMTQEERNADWDYIIQNFIYDLGDK